MTGISEDKSYIEQLEKALAPLVAIANAYDANELDDGARKYWGATGVNTTPPEQIEVYWSATGVNTTPPEQIELYQGRGGRQLLTLADCILARQIINSRY